MADLQTTLGRVVAEAMEAEGFDPSLGRLSASDRPDLADFQCNGALAAAQAAKRSGGPAIAPRDLAARLASRLVGRAGFASVDVAGPGFLNVRVDAAALGARVDALGRERLAGAEPVSRARRVVIDYAGPNVAKPMHVGHLRASIIGEALKRLFRARGDQVWGDAHFGDWGFQMGLLIVAVADEQPRSPFFDPEAAQYPAESPVTLDDLERLYPLAAARAKVESEYRDRARRATAELQSGRAGYRALWRHFVEVSRGALEREFAALGVAFDLWNGESDADAYVPAMLVDLRAKGLLVEDEGAQIVRVAREGDRRELPPLLVVSSEGSSMYGTTDLATIVQRRAEIDPELILYCVDQRQSDHFEQVFRAAYLADYAQPGGLEHAPNGTMNGADGKPFKTRAGGVLKLHDLITQATDKARERLREADLGGELDAAAFEATARMVGVAALKFADLSNFRGTSYVFDLDRFTSFEGRTGPYLLYQAVRIKSLMRRAEAQAIAGGAVVVEAVAERELSLTLDAFAHATREAYDRRAPNLLADHAFRLAQAFSRFYAACPVLAAESATQGASRLALAAAALKQLETVLDWLGIEVPERM